MTLYWSIECVEFKTEIQKSAFVVKILRYLEIGHLTLFLFPTCRMSKNVKNTYNLNAD